MTVVLTFLVSLACLAIVVIVPICTSADYTAIYGPVTFLDSAQAVLLCTFLASIAALLICRSEDHRTFLLQLFLAALLIRLVVATAIFVFNLQAFFGGDAFTYDSFAYLKLQGWMGDEFSGMIAQNYVQNPGAGWGMIYFVAGLYGLIGRNMLATQLINAVLGAATAPLLFLTTRAVVNDIRVARWTAFGVAFMPSLVLWSAQGLKDGPIMFFLALSILATLKLVQRLTVSNLLVLIGALLCIMAFRFYVLYMLVAAILGTLVIGTRAITAENLGRQMVLLVLLGVAMSFFGAIMGARGQIERYSSLEVLQTSRLDAATSANSGFGKNLDVSTAGGAVSAIPQGLAYLLLAPFPWQLGSPRQAITMPEMFVWWVSFPMFMLGICFCIRFRLRQVLPVLLFTVMLTLAYSVFQGNIGNAYRQRAQLLIFYFIFTAVGYDVMLERGKETPSKRAS